MSYFLAIIKEGLSLPNIDFCYNVIGNVLFFVTMLATSNKKTMLATNKQKVNVSNVKIIYNKNK